MAGATPTEISASVGRDAANFRPDVFAVQGLINAHLPAGTAALDQDGRCGPLTIGAIEAIQRSLLSMANPDGRVDPHGATLRALNGGGGAVRPPPPPQVARPQGGASVFPPDVIAAARASEQTWGIPASVTLAQWALESGYGRSMPNGSNNPFGIKAAAGQPYVEANTGEVVQGQSIRIVARFRQFNSLTDAFDQHGRLLATARPYARARGFLSNPNTFADALTGVYATDPNYGTKLRRMMTRHNLYQYNAGGQ